MNAKSLGDLDTYLMRLSMGNRTWEELPVAINVLTFVDDVDKKVEGFRKQYDSLSEYAHPSFTSERQHCTQETNKENITGKFLARTPSAGSAQTICIMNLSVALMIFRHAYRAFAELMPDFVSATAQLQLPEQPGKGPRAA